MWGFLFILPFPSFDYLLWFHHCPLFERQQSFTCLCVCVCGCTFGECLKSNTRNAQQQPPKRKCSQARVKHDLLFGDAAEKYTNRKAISDLLPATK